MKITPTDEKKELGIWVEYYGVELFIARYKTSTAIKKFEEISSRTNKNKRYNSSIYNEETRPIMIELLAEFVLLDWNGFVYKGQDIPYTKQSARTLLNNDEDLLDFVASYSMNMNNYLVEDESQTMGE